MTKLLKIGLAILGLLAIGSGARAQQPALYLDAATPGDNPTTTWRDLSTNKVEGYDFTVLGTVTHNPGSLSYTFPGNPGDIMQGGISGDEADFDFDTDIGDAETGETNRTPITIVAYMTLLGRGSIINKGENAGLLWHVGAGPDFAQGPNGYSQLHLAVNNTSNRMLPRWGPGGNRMPGVADGNFHLWVWHTDGSGTRNMPGGTTADAVTGLYIDGSLTEAAQDGVIDGLAGSILNDAELRIGNVEGGSDYYAGEIGFIEVWAGDLPGGVTAAQYGQTRWNGGNPDRGGVVPPPPPLPVAPIFQADRWEVTYQAFDSVLDDVYRLEYSLPPDTGTWFETGWGAIGDGTTILSFDPTEPSGSSTGKNYRVRKLN